MSYPCFPFQRILGPEKLDGWLKGAQHTSHSDSGPGGGVADSLGTLEVGLLEVKSMSMGKLPQFSHLHDGAHVLSLEPTPVRIK